MSVKIIVGSVWGDEGKGKVVAHFTKDAQIVTRFAGGDNAGHTLYHKGKKIVFSLLPCGMLQERVHCVLAQGMVINPVVLYDEIMSVQKLGISAFNRVYISENAHVILPEHISKDLSLLSSKIGTTKKGIGPTYTAKISRNGIRMIDLCRMSNAELKELFTQGLDLKDEKEAEALDKFEKSVRFLSDMLVDTSYYLNSAIDAGSNILLEGAQGTLLDVDHGTYPFVTSSNCTAGGACTGSGIGPTKITDVIGISKAYVTRVGGGPFPTEITGLIGSEEYKLATWLREAGGEYGAVTGRPRKVGWLDLPALRYAKQINGLTELVITKLDILSGLKEIKVCTGYTNGTESIKKFPISALDKFRPEYLTFPGWDGEISKTKLFSKLPGNAKKYIEFIEEQVNLKVSLISVGPETDSIIRK